jgi:molybdopterin-guanine dinucleotide biosynthesis protein A
MGAGSFRSGEPAAPRGPSCAGVVLAGGMSRRMGAEKAALSIAGEPLLARVVARLRLALPDVMVVGPQRLRELVPHIRIVQDQTPGLGPLGGLATALDVVSTEHAFVVASDMPFIAPALVLAMAQIARSSPDVEAVVLATPEGDHVLHAVYAKTALSTVRAQLMTGDRSLRSLADSLRVRYVSREEAHRHDPTGLSWFNANTPAEWQRALDLDQEEAPARMKNNTKYEGEHEPAAGSAERATPGADPNATDGA